LNPLRQIQSLASGESLNDAKAWTSFGDADGTELFEEDSNVLLNDTGIKRRMVVGRSLLSLDDS
jgi:hypothetical protein